MTQKQILTGAALVFVVTLIGALIESRFNFFHIDLSTLESFVNAAILAALTFVVGNIAKPAMKAMGVSINK